MDNRISWGQKTESKQLLAMKWRTGEQSFTIKAGKLLNRSICYPYISHALVAFKFSPAVDRASAVAEKQTPG